MHRSWCIVLVATFLSIGCAIEGAAAAEFVPKSIGFVVPSEHGHFAPMAAVMEQLLARGHHVHTYMVKTTHGTYLDCKVVETFSPAPACHYVGLFNTSSITPELVTEIVQKSNLEGLDVIAKQVAAFNHVLVPGLLEHLRGENAEKLDALVVDFACHGAVVVGDALNIPSIMMWPLVLQFPVQSNPAIPALAFGQSSNMNWGERFLNYIHQRLSYFLMQMDTLQNDLRTSLGVRLVDIYELYQRRHVITPSIFGLDIAQPLCPNVHPVGILRRAGGSATQGVDVVPPEWQKWLDQCTGGVIYINMGSVARLPKEWQQKFERAAYGLVESGYCVLWKLMKDQHHLLEKPVPKVLHAPLHISTHVPFSPRHVLRHPHTKVFVTHCGDTSVYETVEIGVPLVGVPLFADQSDMCARVQDAGIGISLNKLTFTPEMLIEAVKKMVDNEQATKKAIRIGKMGKVQGGSARAADVVEMVAQHPETSAKFYCRHFDLPWYQLLDADVLLVHSFVLFLLFLVLKGVVMCCCGRCCCKRSKRTQQKTKTE